MRSIVLAVLACAGCNSILGLDPTHRGGDGGEPDAPGPVFDANPDDVDGDGVPNAHDNCPDVANADQADEDHDTVGDVCDNCPEIANSDQGDQLEVFNGLTADGIGDACDPNPSQAGDVRALFEPFNDPARLAADWKLPIGTWMEEGGALRQLNASAATALAYYDHDVQATVIRMRSQVLALPSMGAVGSIGAGTWGALDRSSVTGFDGDHPNGYLCAIVEAQPAPVGGASGIITRWIGGAIETQVAQSVNTTVNVGDEVDADVVNTPGVSLVQCTPSLQFISGPTSIDDPKHVDTGAVGLYTQDLTVAFTSVTIYTR